MGGFFLTSIKLIIAVLLLPAIVAGIGELPHHFSYYPDVYQKTFSFGLLAFLIVYLFIYPFWEGYELSQKIMRGIFSFIAPLDRFISTLIPFYFTGLMIFLWGIKSFLKKNHFDVYFVFLGGVFLMMHVLLMAQDLREQDKQFLKPTYFFVVNCSLLVNILLTVLLFDLVSGHWSFPAFFHQLLQKTQKYYGFIWGMIP